MSDLGSSLAEVGGILVAGGVPGYLAASAFVPGGPARTVEKLAWGFSIGASLIASIVPLSFLARVPPGWLPLLILGGLVALGASRFALDRSGSPSPAPHPGPSWMVFLLLLPIVFGVSRYALIALAEPMSAFDYLGLWGLKAKTIFGAGEVPDRLFSAFTLRFSLPEYPLGLPLLYAGTAFLLGRWDDHALALLFPLFQAAALAALYAWLRRRGASRALALGAVSPFSVFYPLYANSVGTAEVPLSLGVLLFGTSLADGLDATDRGALRRLAFGAFFVVSIKDEGWFVVLAAALVVAASALMRRRRPPFSLLAAALLPGAAVRLLHVLRRGPMPFQAFDFGYLSASRLPELAGRVKEVVTIAVEESVLPAWPALLALLLVAACGRKTPSASVLFGVLALCVAAYVVLPAFSPDPVRQIRNSFERTVAALAPLLAAALALRLVPVFSWRGAALAPVD